MEQLMQDSNGKEQPLTVGQIIKWIEQLAPPALAEDWDPIGLQVGDKSSSCDKIVTTLTLSHRVIDEAIDAGAQMIVAHHPLIFKPLSSVDPTSRVGSLLIRLIKEDIGFYAAHTNLDAAAGGLNDSLAEKLGLEDVKAMSDASAEMVGIGRIGKLPKALSGSELVQAVKEALSINHVRTVGDLDQIIKTVAVVGGSGASFLYDAIAGGADALITGDVDFHDADEALHAGILVVDAGHFGTEKHISFDLARYLMDCAAKVGRDLTVIAARESDPFRFH